MLKPIRRVARPAAVAVLAAATLAAAPAPAAECRWLIQPYVSEATLEAGRPTFDIRYQGLERRAFYGFTASAHGLDQELAAGPALPDLIRDGRPLEVVETPIDKQVYRLDPMSPRPETIVLVAAAAPVPALERLGARIEPARQVAVSQYVPLTRGGSDRSGALPPRRAPAAVAEAGFGEAGDLTICAYEVAAR